VARRFFFRPLTSRASAYNLFRQLLKLRLVRQQAIEIRNHIPVLAELLNVHQTRTPENPINPVAGAREYELKVGQSSAKDP
jgi:hypothetical protein